MSTHLFTLLPQISVVVWTDPVTSRYVLGRWFASGLHFGNLIYPVGPSTFAVGYESIGTLYEKRRLMFQGAGYPDGDTNLLPYWKTSAFQLRIHVHDEISLDNRQILVTFEVESPTQNKAQLFVGDEMALDFDVRERRLASVLLDPLHGFNYVTLRPQKNWLCYYNVQVYLIE